MSTPDRAPLSFEIPDMPEVPKGVSTYLGIALAVLAFAATVASAIAGADVPTIVGGAGTLGTFVTVMGLRVTQGLTMAKHAARVAGPALTALSVAAEPLRSFATDDPELTARLESMERVVAAAVERMEKLAQQGPLVDPELTRRLGAVEGAVEEVLRDPGALAPDLHADGEAGLEHEGEHPDPTVPKAL